LDRKGDRIDHRLDHHPRPVHHKPR
jgi:hypothetical protein